MGRSSITGAAAELAELAREPEHPPEVTQLAVDRGDRGLLLDSAINVFVDLGQVDVGRAGEFERDGERLDLMHDIFPVSGYPSVCNPPS